MRIIVVIPARYQSSRFPGKPLADICGKPMIQWVYEGVMSNKSVAEVYVATDDQRIFDCVESFGGKSIMTGECSCGTDRVYQACKEIDCDIVLNIQGDEPLASSELIDDIISCFDTEDVVMATLKKRIVDDEDINNANVVKVITDCNSDAIYFSRYPIPYNRDGRQKVRYYKHIGVYGYRKEFLQRYVNMTKSDLECVESLEQLRVIENGYKIRVGETNYQSIGVDEPKDIIKVKTQIERMEG